MKILEKLAQLANELDAKGFFNEASHIDEIIKEAVEWPMPSAPPAPDTEDMWSQIDQHFEEKQDPKKTVMNFPDDVIRARQPQNTVMNLPEDVIRARSPQHIQNIRNLRSELGLNPDPAIFDRSVAMVLNKYFPGVWQAGSRQKASNLLAAVKQQKAMGNAGVATQSPKQEGMRGEPVGQTQSIGPLDTGDIPQVELPKKTEHKL